MFTKAESVSLMVTCPLCCQTKSFQVPEGGLTLFEEGEKVQVAFPDLKPKDRELLVSGICEMCWGKYEFKGKGFETEKQSRENRKCSIRYHRVQAYKPSLSAGLHEVQLGDTAVSA